jgi:hypothetical protein
MAAATHEPLPFRVRMYIGNLMVSGRIAPEHWWYDLTRRAIEADLNAHRANVESPGSTRWGKGRQQKDPETSRSVMQQSEASLAALRAAQQADRSDGDEVTLIEVRIYPADFRNDTAGGSQQLAVARIPVTSVTLWWIVEEETMPGRDATSSSWGVGVVVPLG